MEHLLSYIPATKPFYRRKRRVISGMVQLRLKQLEILQLTPETLSRITPKVAKHEYKLARRSVSESGALSMFMIPGMLAGLLSLFSGLFVSSLWPKLNASSFGWLWNFFLYLPVVGLAFAFALWPGLLGLHFRRRHLKARGDVGVAVFLVVWFGIVVSLYSFVVYHYVKTANVFAPSGIAFVLIEGMTGFLAFVAFLIIVGFALSQSGRAFNRRTKAIYPDSVVVQGFQNVAFLLRAKPEAWNNLNFKHHLMMELESIASCVQHNFSARMKSGDAITDFWIRERSMQMAAAIRFLKQWIVTPMSDTYEGLCSRVTNNFIQAVDGNWDELDRIEPPKLSQRQLLARAGTILHGLILGALPLVGWFLLQQSQFRLEGAIADYTKLITIAWAVVSLLSTFDPAFKEKLNAAKDLGSSLTSGGKG